MIEHRASVASQGRVPRVAAYLPPTNVSLPDTGNTTGNAA